jgi:hypothetical protein
VRHTSVYTERGLLAEVSAVAAAARVSAVQGDAAVTPGAVDVPMTCNQFLQLNTAADSGAEQSLCITCCGSSIIKKN